MKLNSILTAAVFLMGASLSASAQVIITNSYAGTLGTMPGSATDYTFFGNGSEFPGLPDYVGTHPATQPTVLTDFTPAVGANAGGQYSGDSGYSLINGPVGSGEPSVETGDFFGPGSAGGDKPDMVEFTLGTPGSTFNFSNFYVYVMYGNGPGDANDHITNLDLSVYSGATLLGSDTPVLVTDANTSTSVAYFEQFHITGASATDVIKIGSGAISPFSSYVGGVSFSQTSDIPEPLTWALMLAGIALLGVCLRRKRAGFNL